MSEYVLQTMLEKVLDRIDQRFNRLEKSIEALAGITKSGFEQVDLRFDRLAARMDRMEIRQDQMAYRFEFKALSGRIDRLEPQAGVQS